MRNRDPAMVLHHGPGFWLWPIIREFICSYIFGFSKIGISEIYTNFVFQHLLNIDRPSVCILSMLSYVNIVKSISNINLFWKGNTARVNYTRVYHWYTNKNNNNTIKAQSFHSKIVDPSFQLNTPTYSPAGRRGEINRRWIVIQFFFRLTDGWMDGWITQQEQNHATKWLTRAIPLMVAVPLP